MYMQVREDCRRRMADAEKRAVTNAEHLEARVREIEAELGEALLLNQRFRNCRIVDPDQQRDVAMQVDLEMNDERPGDVRQVRSRSPSIDGEHPPTETLDGDSIVDDTRVSTETATSRSSDVIANTPISDQVWYHLYETVTALALHRVRYLEELAAVGSRRQRLPETQAQLRRLQVLRRRIVKCDGSAGVNGGSRPQRHGNKETRISTALSTDVNYAGKKSADGVNGNSQTVSSSRLTLRRTSSCPAPDIFVRVADDNSVDGAFKDERYADDALRSKSADKLCEMMVNRTPLDADAVAPSLSSQPRGQLTDCFSSSTTIMSEMCDSAFGSIRMSPSADEIETDDDFRSGMGGEKTTAVAPLAHVTPMSSAKVRPRVAVADVTEASTITRSSTSTSKNTKRYSSLHLEIFRKLQTGVTNRRRDRSSFITSGTTLPAGSDDHDDRSDIVGRRSLSRNSTQSSSNKEASGTTKSTQVHPTATASGPLRAFHSRVTVGGSIATNGVDEAQSPPPFDVSSSSGDTRLRSLLRRSLPLSPRRFDRESPVTSFSFECSSDIASAASEFASVVGNETVVKDDTGVALNSTLTSSPAPATPGNGRPKSSSFGRLHERRNGLTTAGSIQFKAVSASGSGQQVLRNRTPSQSRLDSLAKNIKTYLTNQ